MMKGAVWSAVGLFPEKWQNAVKTEDNKVLYCVPCLKYS